MFFVGFESCILMYLDGECVEAGGGMTQMITAIDVSRP